MVIDIVRNYYANFGEREWTRLENPDDGALEFAVTKYTLEKYLPQKARILDVGGGPGRYTIWLAEHNNQVVLADISPNLLEIARIKIFQSGVSTKVEEIVEADARDLSQWGNESFDAVLCLGPFYHLPDLADREQVAAEINRVLRPEGLAFIAMMTRYSFLQRTLAIPDERHHLSQPDFIDNLLQNGLFLNDQPGRFTCGWGAIPQEVATFFEDFGFSSIDLLSTEGIFIDNQRSLIELAESDPKAYEAAFRIVVNTANDPSILGMATHLLYIGKKKLSY